MTPPQAALICEENPQCGGFTYKVREPIKYYAAECLRKEQMGTPSSATSSFWQKIFKDYCRVILVLCIVWFLLWWFGYPLLGFEGYGFLTKSLLARGE